ncbi:MAG TPA: stage III sporulation protein AB, partial [Verrucomicrobiae bacterium]|nr:stage III sporulation protein AB [Verrucomicrobiae bacterium]
MLRWFALLLIIACSGAFGLIMARRYSLRPKQLREFHQAIEALETEISYGSTPLPQALNAAATGLDYGLDSFLKSIGEQILSGHQASTAWQKSCRDAENMLCLTTDDWKIITQVGIGLGTTDRQEEKKKLRLACIRLQAAEEKAALQSGKLAKMWSYMGFLAGCALALVI